MQAPVPTPAAVPSDAFSPIDFLLDPASQFPRLAARPRFAAPMAMLLVGTVGLYAACYARLDYAWYTQQLLATHPIVARLGPAGGLHLDRATVLGPAVVSVGLGTLAAWMATALYVLFLGAASKRPVSFGQSLALAAWTKVPYIVALLPSAIHLALHPDGRVAPEQLDPGTLAMLLGSLGHPFLDNVAARVGLADLWAWALLAIGLRSVLSLRWWTSVAAVAAPALPWTLGGAIVAAAGGA